MLMNFAAKGDSETKVVSLFFTAARSEHMPAIFDQFLSSFRAKTASKEVEGKARATLPL